MSAKPERAGTSVPVRLAARAAPATADAPSRRGLFTPARSLLAPTSRGTWSTRSSAAKAAGERRVLDAAREALLPYLRGRARRSPRIIWDVLGLLARLCGLFGDRCSTMERAPQRLATKRRGDH